METTVEAELLRDVEVAMLYGLSVTGLRAYIRRGLAPVLRKLGHRSRWVRSEVLDHLRRLPAAVEQRNSDYTASQPAPRTTEVEDDPT